MDRVEKEIVEALVRYGRIGSLDAFLAQGDRCGWCRRPVRLRPTSGQRVSSDLLPDGTLLKACGNRRETRCPACATVYRDDARHLVRAGLAGGKGVDEAVHFPGAGLEQRTIPRHCAHGRPLQCSGTHLGDDPDLGSPVCSDCYDFEGAVLHNAVTPELWRRTTIYLQRQLAAVLGTTQAECRRRVRLATCRAAEFQRRGVVHLHAVVRADPADPDEPPVTVDQLTIACLRAATAVSVPHPRGVARWGEQVDVQPIEGDDAQRVAGYIAKYATKSSVSSGELDHRVISDEDIATREIPAHLRDMAAAAWRLGAETELESFRLRRHAHSLGYGGYFLSKSRGYSTTFAALRRARSE
jgi:hypothetical protein